MTWLIKLIKLPKLYKLEAMNLDYSREIIEAAPSPPKTSISQKLALYGSASLSGMEHLTLLVGKQSVANALIRQFGSLKALSRASFGELRQFLTQRSGRGRDGRSFRCERC